MIRVDRHPLGAPKVDLAGPGWAGPGLFGRRGRFASILSSFFFFFWP